MPGRGRGQKRKGGRGGGGGGGGGDDRLMKKDFRKSRDDVWDPKKSRKPNGAGEYNLGFSKENAKFEEYYKAQKIVPEDEWDAFMDSLRTPLPTSFRINGRCAHTHAHTTILSVNLFGIFCFFPSPINRPPTQRAHQAKLSPPHHTIYNSGKFAEDIRDQIENKLFAKVASEAAPMDTKEVRMERRHQFHTRTHTFFTPLPLACFIHVSHHPRNE